VVDCFLGVLEFSNTTNFLGTYGLLIMSKVKKPSLHLCMTPSYVLIT
jgi:hypothetical protein